MRKLLREVREILNWNLLSFSDWVFEHTKSAGIANGIDRFAYLIKTGTRLKLNAKGK